MRSAEQISRTVEEWHDHQAAERRQTLRELLAILRRAAATGEAWYYDALGIREQLRRRDRPEELPPEPDPDSPFQPPRLPEPERQESLFGG